jgi:hypothetical protein
MCSVRACLHVGELPGKASYSRGGTDKRSVYTEPSYSAFAAWLPHDAEMAPKYKKDFSRLNVKKRYKMYLKYKNKRREIQENLSNGSYVFLSYYISNIKAHTFYLGQPSYPGKVFTWQIFIPRLSDIPPLSAGNSPRRVTRLHHVNSHPG